VCQISIFRPSLCATTTLKKCLIVPLKATIFEKFTFTIKENVILCPIDEKGYRCEK
jgi:hypothetical protein